MTSAKRRPAAVPLPDRLRLSFGAISWGKCLLPALLAVLLTGTERPAQAAFCPTPEGYQLTIRVQTDFGETTYLRTLDHAGLKALGEKYGQPHTSGKNTVVNGQTLSQPRLASDIKMLTQTLPDKTQCIWLTEMTVMIRVSEFTVYLASELPVGSCGYEVTLEHENQHVRLTREAILRQREHIDAVLQSVLPPISPLQRRPGQPDPVKVTQEKLSNRFISEISDAINRANAPLDTPENYAATQRRCPQW